MHRETTIRALVLAALPWGLSHAAYGQSWFMGIGRLEESDKYSFAAGVANAGDLVVVGTSWDWDYQPRAFRWTAQSGTSPLEDLPGGKAWSQACGVSADGKTIAGTSIGEHGYEACLWSDGGPVGLGDLPGGQEYSSAEGISADGNTVVGTADGGGSDAFRWSAQGGMLDLGDLTNFYTETAYCASADGSAIAGEASTDLGYRAFYWSDATGLLDLGLLPGFEQWSSVAFGISPEGKVVVGASHIGWDASQAFRWSEQDGLVALDRFPEWEEARALGASQNGSVIVGAYAWMNRACFWTPDGTIHDLRDALIASGATGLDGWALSAATSVSAEGSIIAGYGYNSESGHTEAWVARLATPCYPDLTGDGELDLFDFLAYVNAFNAQDPLADCDGDAEFSLFDFLCFVNLFNDGC